MSDFKVIGAVGETLKNLLSTSEYWIGITKPEITLKSPKQLKDEPSNNTNKNKVSIFLYQIVENIHLKNEELQRIDNTTLRKTPPGRGSIISDNSI